MAHYADRFKGARRVTAVSATSRNRITRDWLVYHHADSGTYLVYGTPHEFKARFDPWAECRNLADAAGWIRRNVPKLRLAH